MSRNHERIKNDPRWKRVRLEALDRDDHACVICGGTEGLEVDHITPLADALDPEHFEALAFDLDNLQTLCKTHHIEKEKNTAEQIRITWINLSLIHI